MAEITDHYKALGVTQSASAAQLKVAYRELVRRYHPDRNPDEETAARFREVQRAYEVLSDATQRSAYDLMRSSSFGNGGLTASMASDSFRQAHQSGATSSELGALFSFMYQQGGGEQWDIDAEVTLSFEQALRGGKTEVRLADGEFVRMMVPKGAQSGLKVRVRGRGRQGPEGQSGDLYVTFRVGPSARFRREGRDLYVTEPVTAMEAILGTSRSIVNAYGRTVTLQIPPGTQPGERLRLRGQGVATSKTKGDLYVEVQVSIPRTLTDAQRELLKRCADDIGLL